MNHDLRNADPKKPYEPPKVTTISLRPEEAVLGHCKNASATGPAQGTCNAIVPCGSFGS
jgi:hypothetical protein